MTAVIFIIANIIYEIDELYTRSTRVAHWKRNFVESFVESLFAIDAHTIYRMHSTFCVVATISLMLFFFSQEKCESKRERRVHLLLLRCVTYNYLKVDRIYIFSEFLKKSN